MSDSSDSTANMDRMRRNKVEHERQTHQVLQVSYFFRFDQTTCDVFRGFCCPDPTNLSHVCVFSPELL